MSYTMTHLRQLEAESIHIIREVAAEFANPVMLYSIGKDSAVMLHLARKAFYPARPPFPSVNFFIKNNGTRRTNEILHIFAPIMSPTATSGTPRRPR